MSLNGPDPMAFCHVIFTCRISERLPLALRHDVRAAENILLRERDIDGLEGELDLVGAIGTHARELRPDVVRVPSGYFFNSSNVNTTSFAVNGTPSDHFAFLRRWTISVFPPSPNK